MKKIFTLIAIVMIALSANADPNVTIKNIPSTYNGWRNYAQAVLTDTLKTDEKVERTPDVNFDGKVDSQDVLAVYDYMKNSTETPTASTHEDVNHDGKVDSQDILAIYDYMKTFTPDMSNLLPGKFSVSADKQVQFTKSNLYWDGSAFKFEANQTDYPTSWDASHVGHFFWTKFNDYKSGAASYMPYAEKYNTSSGDPNAKFWCGEDNPITVDGTDGLYALTGASGGEWNYLIKKRTNASSLYKYGVTITNGSKSYANCLIIAPDDFTGTLQSSYTLDEVNAAGLVCLPAAGWRDNSSLILIGDRGFYWSSTTTGAMYELFFKADGIDPATWSYASSGFSLRLVRNL